jgi:muconolactone delta-isomerase
VLFLVELDHVTTTTPVTPEAARAFIEQVIFPTIARVDQLIAEKKILSGGPVAGRIALRFIVEADSSVHVDQMISSLPLWLVAQTRVTPLVAFAERRQHVQTLLENLGAGPSSETR